MIPKIIHYCWLSGDPFPLEIQRCIDTWHKMLPDYEFRLWDTKRFDIDSTKWTRQAFDNKKYAFAADYIRLYALYNEGGIYLDSDVFVYKSFDELLSLPYFIGCDQIGAFEAAVIGAEKGCEWIGEILKRYDGREFVKEDGSLDMMELPIVFHHRRWEEGYGFTLIHGLRQYGIEPKRMYVFDGDHFNSRNQIEARRTRNSYCAHNYAGSWQKKAKGKVTLTGRLKNLMPKWMLNLMLELSHKTWNRNKYSWFMIPFDNQC